MYGRADRLLHTLALGFAPVLEASFDIERARHRRAIRDVPVERPLFVAGLARAGTTILTRTLEASGGFASLTYRDMPFPLAPNSWRGMSGRFRRRVETRERGHGDGLTRDLDSPEAIEEVFWRCHEGCRYLTAEGLIPAEVAPGTVAAFRDYVRLVLLGHPGRRYLSKNNNNVLRLPALTRAFPDAVLLHPFRDPAQQALSLRSQHLRAIALAAGDPFRRRFMGWLGHHEFGADRRPFLLEGGPGPRDDPLSLGYWLKSWIAVHEALLAQPPEVRARQVFLDFDRLRAEGPGLAQRLGWMAGLDAPLDLSALKRPAGRIVAVDDSGLLARAHGVHERLSDAFRSAFG